MKSDRKVLKVILTIPSGSNVTLGYIWNDQLISQFKEKLTDNYFKSNNRFKKMFFSSKFIKYLLVLASSFVGFVINGAVRESAPAA